MLDRENLLGFALLAMDMRERHKAYYHKRTQSALIAMLEAQKLFDKRRKELFEQKEEPKEQPSE